MKRTQMLNSVNKSGVVKSTVAAAPFFSIFSILTASVKPEEKCLGFDLKRLN